MLLFYGWQLNAKIIEEHISVLAGVCHDGIPHCVQMGWTVSIKYHVI